MGASRRGLMLWHGPDLQLPSVAGQEEDRCSWVFLAETPK